MFRGSWNGTHIGMMECIYGWQNSNMDVWMNIWNYGMHIQMAECIYGWRNAYIDVGMQKQMAKCFYGYEIS